MKDNNVRDGHDPATGEAIQLPNVDHIEVGDIFPYDAGGSISYGRVIDIDDSRDQQFKISLPNGLGYEWMNATHYNPDGEDKEILSDKTSDDLIWRVSRYDGR